MNPTEASILQPRPVSSELARRAALHVCGQAVDADDARELLALLGLIPDRDREGVA